MIIQLRRPVPPRSECFFVILGEYGVKHLEPSPPGAHSCWPWPAWAALAAAAAPDVAQRCAKGPHPHLVPERGSGARSLGAEACSLRGGFVLQFPLPALACKPQNKPETETPQ